jgi:hypothetical protein
MRNKITLVLMVLCISILVQARSPIPPWVTGLIGDVTIDRAGTTSIAPLAIAGTEIAGDSIDSTKVLDGTLAEADLLPYDADGSLVQRVVRTTYDFALHGGTIGTIDLGDTLPANALVSRVDAYVATQLVDAGAGTIALECEDAANLEAATDHSGVAAGAMIATDVDGAVGNYVSGISAQCAVSLVIAGANISAGKVIFFIKYYELD